MRASINLAGLIGALIPSSAFALGDVGHRVICQIAYEELKPEIRARVDALVAIDPKFRTFADACTAPDHPHIRSPEHAGLDYVDIAAKLRVEITDDDRAGWVAPSIDVAAVVAWANEFSAIAERPDVQYCVQKDDACWYAPDQPEYRGAAQRVVVVDDAYLTAQAATIRQRLKMAGVRLAAILNTALLPS